MRLVELVDALRAASLTPARALYLIWNQDVGGNSLREEEKKQVNDLVIRLRADLAAIENEFTVGDDPSGDIARARVTLVYGPEATEFLFSLLDNTFVVDVAYEHPKPTLGEAVVDVAKGSTGGVIAYDDVRKRLSFSGLLDTETVETLKNLSGDNPAFQTAVQDLFDKAETE